MNTPIFNLTPNGINYSVSNLSLSGTLSGTSAVTPTFFHYLANGSKETVSILTAGTYSFEVVNDSRWNNDGSYLTALGKITYPDGSSTQLVGRLNTYMGGILFSNGDFDFSSNDVVSESFNQFLTVGKFAPGSYADIGKKFTFTVAATNPTYTITPLSPSVNEGSSITFTVDTKSIKWGSSIPYTLSGISAADVLGSSLSGNAVVNSSGVATISVTLLNDSLTEGAETLTVTAGGATASTLVNDTSKALPTYSLSSSSSSVNEGSTATFTLTTTKVASGTSVPYTLSGINPSDVSGGLLMGNALVNSSGVATISVTLLNDWWIQSRSATRDND
jgi:hypothetical protein